MLSVLNWAFRNQIALGVGSTLLYQPNYLILCINYRSSTKTSQAIHMEFNLFPALSSLYFRGKSLNCISFSVKLTQTTCPLRTEKGVHHF